MKVAFALLPDLATFNAVSKIAWRIHLRFRTGVSVRRLPPHISLKQPFEIDDLDSLEMYLGHLAQSIEPFSIPLSGYCLWETPPEKPVSGILSIQVAESPILRNLHHRLNRELTEQFGERRAAFDGDAYTFHLTVAAGGASVEVYRQAFAAIGGETILRTFVAREIALFVYDHDAGSEDWQYMTYKILPLGNTGV